MHCPIDINRLNEKHPLFLRRNSQDIIYPEPQSSIIPLKESQVFLLNCPGSGKVKADGLIFDKTIEATCFSDEFVVIENHKVNISNTVCSRRIPSVARFTSNICWEEYREIEVGLILPNDKFFHLYSTCFDDVTRNVVYSTYLLSKEIGYGSSGNSRPSWTEGKFYDLTKKLDNLYSTTTQRHIINKQLGLPAEDTTYVKSNAKNFLAKGHLTAKADLFYNAEQQSTFHYINAAPQWQTFNAFNWFYLERNLRKYALDNYVNLIVYTGTYGISTLPHQLTGDEVELYLYEGSDGEKAIPIPELFWKVAYDPVHKAGVAVLGINNPYQVDIEKSIICPDVSAKISWLDFELTKIEAGYMYACSLASLKTVIKDLPNMSITKLLT